MGFYSKFTEQDLIESYKNQIDYQGKATQELLDEIQSRGTLEEFNKKIDNEKKYLEETNRIIRLIHQNYMSRVPMKECMTSIESHLLTQKDIKILTLEKYSQIQNKETNLKVDSDTILMSILGVTIAPFVSSTILILTLYQFQQLIVFNYFLLIPVYIINYFIIKFFVKKTRENLAVFIATLVATLLNCLFFILFIT